MFTAKSVVSTQHVRIHVALPTLGALVLASALAMGCRPLEATAEGATEELSLREGRTGATVSVLPDGRWLIVGGDFHGDAVLATEIVNPATNTSSAGPSLHVKRTEHTATVLSDGRVLVAGGYAEASVEIIDVAAGTSKVVAPLAEPRGGHTATLLADGRVLVVGGTPGFRRGSDPRTRTYDPVSDRWSEGPWMTLGRESHTATRLADGAVLLVGGNSSNGVDPATRLASVERFDPATNEITSLGTLLSARAEHTASLLADGSILVTGGYDLDGVATDSAERLRPAARTSEPVAPMGVARRGHSAVVIGDRVVVVSGFSDAPDSEMTSQIFDVASSSWQMPARLEKPHGLGVAAAAGGDVFACGGIFRNQITQGCEKVSLAAGPSVPSLARTKSVRFLPTASRGDDYVNYMRHAERLVYDDARGLVISLSRPDSEHGPQSTYAWDGTSVFEVGTAAVSPNPTRAGFGLASDAGRRRVVLFGGARRPNFNMNETWEWDGAGWTNVTPASGSPSVRVGPQMTYDTKNGRVLMFGGRDNEKARFDLWAWDGSAWTELDAGLNAHPGAADFGGNAFAFDQARGVAVLESTTGTWEWDGGWKATGKAAGSTHAALAYDPFRQAIIAHVTPGNGCETRSSSSLLLWTNGDWSKTAGTYDGPSGGCTGTVYGVFDENRRRMVIGGAWKVGAQGLAEIAEVEPPNRAPKISNVRFEPQAPVFAGTPITIRFDAQDPDGHEVAAAVNNLPAGAVFDAQERTIRWTPEPNQVGAQKFTLDVSDGIRFASDEVTVDVQRFESSLFPTGGVRLRANPTWSGSSRDCTQRPVGSSPRCETRSGDTGYATCDVTGENPGRVTIRCSGQTNYGWRYDDRGTWAPGRHDLQTNGDVAADGVWSARGGSFTMSGTIRKGALGDLELCVGGARFEMNAYVSADYASTACTPLHPMQ